MYGGGSGIIQSKIIGGDDDNIQSMYIGGDDNVQSMYIGGG